jgi:DNA-binding transcriptional ArsR family regulator
MSPGACYLRSVAKSDGDQLDYVFRALAHPVRRAMLRQLARGEQSISELAEPFDMSFEAVSKHVQMLERARLVRRTRVGRMHRCTLEPASLSDAARVLTELAGLWTKQLDSLERMLAAMQSAPHKKRS